MKNKILEGLKAKFEGISTAELSRIATKMAETVTNEEEATTAVEGVTIQQILKSYGDSRANDAAVVSVANYEKKHGLKEGKPTTGAQQTGPKKPEGTPEDEPAWVKTQREKIEALEAKLAAMDGDKVATTRKQQLTAAMEKAPAKLRERYEKDLTRMSFKDDDEYNAWLTEVKTDTEAFVAEAVTKGAVFGRPMGSGNTPPATKPSAEVEAWIKAREAEPVATAIAGLPKTN